MKKIVLSLIGLTAFNFAIGQTPITLTQANYPVFTDFVQRQPTSISNPTTTPNNSWDYGTANGTSSTNPYYPETDPFYTAAGIDSWTNGFVYMTSSLGYNVAWEFDFNTNGVDEAGIYVYPQAYDLAGLTGSVNDSIFYPQQGYIFTSPRRILKFPCTFNDNWNSVSRREVNFVMNVPAFGLNYAPAKHIFTVTKQDTIKSWGKMRLYTPTGPSIYYDVIMNKIKQTTIDSFYLGGTPAPAALLSAFGVSQGQVTVSNRYIFYRENYSTPMAVFNYGSNNYTTPVSVFLEANNLQTSGTGLEEAEISHAAVFFPNPTNSGLVNVQFVGISLSEVTYSVLDLQGKVVQSGSTAMSEGNITISLHSALTNGMYHVQIQDNSKGILASEQIIVNR
jgi:hypothetical protein